MVKKDENRLELSDFQQITELLEKCLWWHPEAVQELRNLPPTIQLEAIQHLLGIVRKPTMGKPLEYKHGMDLRGYRKIFFDSATRRIVYSIADDGRLRIWSMGLRNDLQTYKDTKRRSEE